MDSDEQLFQRVRQGDMPSFDRLYERYERQLFAYVRAMLADRRDAEEVLHDAFLAALDADSVRFDEGGFRAYLFRTARNRALNKARARGRSERVVRTSALVPPEVVDDGPASNASRMLEARELETALAAAVARLPIALGEVYHLRSSGLSYEQMANVVEVPLGTIKSRMFQMVNVLRQELSPWIAPE